MQCNSIRERELKEEEQDKKEKRLEIYMEGKLALCIEFSMAMC